MKIIDLILPYGAELKKASGTMRFLIAAFVFLIFNTVWLMYMNVHTKYLYQQDLHACIGLASRFLTESASSPVQISKVAEK